jgi:hypothetical protein
LTNRGAIGNGIEVVTSYKILQSGNAVADEVHIGQVRIQKTKETKDGLSSRARFKQIAIHLGRRLGAFLVRL